MAIQTTGLHPKALWPGVYAFFGHTYDQYPLECVDLYDKKTTKRAYEEVVQSSSFGLAPVKPQGQALSFDTHKQGYVSRFTQVVYGLTYGITQEEREDNLYTELSMERAGMLAFSMIQTKETVLANRYNRAFDPAFTYGDGESLISTAHPDADGGGQQSNRLTVDSVLSELAIEDMLTQISLAKNSRGLTIKLLPQTLHVHPNEWWNANRILKSVLQNDTNDNALNVLKSTGALPGGVKMNHYFTDAKAWFVRTNAPKGMILFQRREVDFDKDNDFITKNALASATERYIGGTGDWRALYGSGPA